VPFVSVLLPYRNAAHTVEEALESVLADADDDLEIVAVDDGSRDDGPSRVRRIAARDRRVVPTETGGVGIARALAHAVDRARGDLLARMDGDDVWLPGRLGAQRESFERAPEVAVVGCQVEIFPDAGPGMRAYVEWQNALLTPRDHARDLFVESPLCHPSVMMRRDALDAVGGFRDAPWAEDYDLWLRFHAHGGALAKVPVLGLRWRHSAGRATFSNPLYSAERFLAARTHYLAPVLRSKGRPVVVWGAGPTGKRLARALERNGVSAAAFIDIDPRKIGRTARGAPIVPFRQIRRGENTVVVAVGTRGARAIIRRELDRAGFVEMEDYFAAA
jgi:glycosyltransferase involved in cell wall biosynthesis